MADGMNNNGNILAPMATPAKPKPQHDEGKPSPYGPDSNNCTVCPAYLCTGLGKMRGDGKAFCICYQKSFEFQKDSTPGKPEDCGHLQSASLVRAKLRAQSEGELQLGQAFAMVRIHVKGEGGGQIRDGQTSAAKTAAQGSTAQATVKTRRPL